MQKTTTKYKKKQKLYLTAVLRYYGLRDYLENALTI